MLKNSVITAALVGLCLFAASPTQSKVFAPPSAKTVAKPPAKTKPTVKAAPKPVATPAKVITEAERLARLQKFFEYCWIPRQGRDNYKVTVTPDGALTIHEDQPMHSEMVFKWSQLKTVVWRSFTDVEVLDFQLFPVQARSLMVGDNQKYEDRRFEIVISYDNKWKPVIDDIKYFVRKSNNSPIYKTAVTKWLERELD